MVTRLGSSAVFECTTDHRQVGKVLEEEQFRGRLHFWTPSKKSADGCSNSTHIDCVLETFVCIQACMHTTGFYFLLGYSL